MIDSRYRTVAVPGGRGLMGFSMGGFGALHLALAHPDLFGAAWSLCPGVFTPGKGLGDAMRTWRGEDGFLKAYAAAFSGKTPCPRLTVPPRTTRLSLNGKRDSAGGMPG